MSFTFSFRSSRVFLAYVLIASLFIWSAESKDETDRKIEATFQDIGGLLFCGFAVMVAAGGGIGGGCLMVPILIAVLGFDPKTAIPISSVGVFGAAAANLLINWRKRHPRADRPLIAWDIILMMEPLTVFGTILGSYLNIVSPSWLLVCMLVLLLGTTSLKILSKGRRMFKIESVAMKRRAEGLPSILSMNHSITNPNGGGKPREMSRTITGEDYTMGYDNDMDLVNDAEILIAVQEENTINGGHGHGQPIDKNDVREQEKTHSVLTITVIGVLTLGVLVLSVLKGDSSLNPFNLTCGSLPYWLTAFSVLPYSVLVYAFGRWHSVNRYYLKERLVAAGRYKWAKGDVKWTKKNASIFPLFCSIAGVFAGLFGIGGGVVKGPLMLEMRVLPSIASATSATMIVFTSSAATLNYALFGALNLHFAPVFLALGFFSALVGRTGLNYVVSKYNRPSLIVFIIALTVGMSTLAMGTDFVIHNLIEGKSNPKTSLC